MSKGQSAKLDETIRLNQIQVIGTHNSYHIQPQPELLQKLVSINERAASLEYSHVPLDEQLQTQRVRQVELDVYADPEGGLFSSRAGLALLGQEIDSGLQQLEKPGFKVMHIPHIDFRTHCLTFTEGLETIKKWSLANPEHLPIMILIEVKGPFSFTIPNIPVKQAIECGIEELDALDQEIRSVFDDNQLITPDKVRGNYPTLEQAILTKGWPTLAEARGKVLFTLDNTNKIRDLYLTNRPSLAGRVLFTSSQPGQPSAAFIKHNDPTGENVKIIQEYVKSGYLVRTMADPKIPQVKEGDTSRAEQALRSGAHFVSTDYPHPGSWGYQVALPENPSAPGRINPVNGGMHLAEEDTLLEG